MGSTAQYWTFLHLSNHGEIRSRPSPATQGFIETEFGDVIAIAPESDRFPHKALQTHLYAALQREPIAGPPTPSNSYHAQFSLRCYISQQIVQTCQALAQQFGAYYHFDRNDLLLLVLDDNGEAFPTEKLVYNKKIDKWIPPYKSTAQEILEKYHPSKSTLLVWVKRLIRQHRDITQFLLDRGLYLISDWAILNDTTSSQVYRILTQHSDWQPSQAETACHLLESFHEIYRPTHTPNTPCQPPTDDAWAAMVERFQTKSNRSITPTAFAEQLSKISLKLRQYRIRARGGSVPEVIQSASPERLEITIDHFVLKQLTYDDNQPIAAFQQQLIKTYEKTFPDLCDRTIAQVIETRYDTFRNARQQRTRNKAESYLHTLQLFYGERMKMGTIAPIVGLKLQEDVTHLLALNTMRADIKRLLIHELINTLRHQLQTYPDPDDPNIQSALTALNILSPDTSFILEIAPPILKFILQTVDDLLQEEIKQSYTANSTEPTSQLGNSIVRYLNQRRASKPTEKPTEKPYVQTS
jgi:hypothetical protein